VKKKKLEDKEKLDNHNKKVEHWNKIYSEWLSQNNQLKGLKAEYARTRNKFQEEARKEYLRAIEEDVNKWVHTPEECRFLRFKFKEGITFPFNPSSPYT